jgi:hypothetical protein
MRGPSRTRQVFATGISMMTLSHGEC